MLQQLKIGYAITKNINNIDIQMYKENNIYFVNGFIGSEHIYKTFEKYNEAKKFYNNPLN